MFQRGRLASLVKSTINRPCLSRKTRFTQAMATQRFAIKPSIVLRPRFRRQFRLLEHKLRRIF